MKNRHGSCLTTMSLQPASNGSKLFIRALSSHRCFNSKAYCLMQVSRELLNSWISLSTVFEQEVCDAILVTAAIIHTLVSEVTQVFFSRLCSFVKIASGSTAVTRLEYSPNTYSQRTDKICIQSHRAVLSVLQLGCSTKQHNKIHLTFKKLLFKHVLNYSFTILCFKCQRLEMISVFTSADSNFYLLKNQIAVLKRKLNIAIRPLQNTICSYCSLFLGWKLKLTQVPDNISTAFGQSPAMPKIHFTTTSGLILMQTERLSACRFM